MRSETIALLFCVIFIASCSHRNENALPASPSPTPAVDRWVLLNAPDLVSENCESEAPCAGTPYVRAPLSDWKREGVFHSFKDCAASISSNDPDAASKDTDESHKQGKLTKAERMLGLDVSQ